MLQQKTEIRLKAKTANLVFTAFEIIRVVFRLTVTGGCILNMEGQWYTKNVVNTPNNFEQNLCCATYSSDLFTRKKLPKFPSLLKLGLLTGELSPAPSGVSLYKKNSCDPNSTVF